MPVPLWPLSAWIDNVALGALSSRETVQASYEIAAAAIRAGVPGDIVECGVNNGSQCAAMARAILDSSNGGLEKYHWSRRVHMFDTFAGVPAAGPNDPEFQQHSAGVSACSVDAVIDHWIEWSLPIELLHIERGLFRDTIPAAKFPSGIAVLRLDGDLYESTKDCLPLIDLVNPGGWIIVDDYHLSGARQAITEKLGYPSPVYFQKHKGA